VLPRKHIKPTHPNVHLSATTLHHTPIYSYDWEPARCHLEVEFTAPKNPPHPILQVRSASPENGSPRRIPGKSLRH